MFPSDIRANIVYRHLVWTCLAEGPCDLRVGKG